MRQSENVSLLSMLPQGWLAFYLSDGGCGCDLYRDPRNEPLTNGIDDRISRFREKHSRPKYRKQGWSATKIERAVAQMRADDTSRPTFVGLRIDLRRALV